MTSLEDVELTEELPSLHRELPASIYGDPERYARELERVLRRQWLLAAPLAEVPERGGLAVVAARAPVLVTRDGEIVRAFHNVCTHRGSAVVSDRAAGDRLICPYHGWTYGLDGRVLALPGEKRFGDLDRGGCGLPEVAARVWSGLVWVNLAERPQPFDEWLGPWRTELERYRMDRQVVLGSRVDRLPLNWKASIDAFNETYHVGFVHPQSVGRLVHAKATRFRYGGLHSRGVIPVRQRLSEAEGRAGRGDGRQRHGKELLPEQAGDHCNYTLFPAVMLNLLATWGIVLRFEPLDVASTELRTWMLADPPRSERHEAALAAQWREFQKVLEEDLEALALVAVGLGSPAFRTIHLGGEEERLIRFHDAVEAALA